MTTEPNNDNNEGYSSVASDVPNTSEEDLLVVFKALESVGFWFIDDHEN